MSISSVEKTMPPLIISVPSSQQPTGNMENIKILILALETAQGGVTFEKVIKEDGIHENITKKRSRQKITPEIIEKMKALAPKIEKGEMTQEQAAAECNIHVRTLRCKLKALSEGKDLKKRKPRQEITPELIEKIKALAPKIKKGGMTQEQAAAECNIHVKTLRYRLKDLNDGKDLTKKRPRQIITLEFIEKIKTLAPKIEKGEMTQEQAAAECNINVRTLRCKLKALSEGKDLTLRKLAQKITPELIEKIKALAPKIEKGEMTQEQAAAECNIHVRTLRCKLKALSEGEKPRQNKPLEFIEKIKTLAPKIEKGEMTQEQAAAECNINVRTLRCKLKALSEGKDFTIRKPPQKITPELIEKIKALAPKIEKGEMTRKQAATECNINVETLQCKLKDLSKGEDLTKKKPPQEKTSVIKEQIVPMTPVKAADAELLFSIAQS